MIMDSTCGETTTTTTDGAGGAATILALPPHIIQTHILTRLDGASLASAACTSTQLHTLSTNEHLWANICHSTWPSTNNPRIRHVIGTFPCGSRSFFSDSFLATTSAQNPRTNPERIPELISAVDIFHRRQLILSKVVETETETGWFSCSPFRVDLLDPKDVVQTPIKYPKGEDACRNLGEELMLSWIVIDPRNRRAMNLSSRKPVSVHQHWLSGEVQLRFTAVISGGERGSPSELALCSLLVTCGGLEGGELQVTEACLQIEDMDGMHLNGRDSLVILQGALEGKREKLRNGVEEGRKKFEEFVKRKREREEEKVRAERRLDMLCVTLAALSFAGLVSLFLIWN